MGLNVCSPTLSSDRITSHAMMTGNANTDLKNTCCPGGTALSPRDVAFTNAAITVKTVTLRHFRSIPFKGADGVGFIKCSDKRWNDC